MKRTVTKLVVGLGNHSLINTRHSIGMAVLNNFTENLGISWQYERNCVGFIAHYITDFHKIIFLKPKFPMNLNGKSIVKTVKKYGVEHEDIYLVHDHLDKPLGKIQMKLNGSAGGHNGVKSTIACLKTNNFKRLRIGIDRPADRNNVVDYVLENFKREELSLVETTIERCTDMLETELGLNSVKTFLDDSKTADSQELVKDISPEDCER